MKTLSCLIVVCLGVAGPAAAQSNVEIPGYQVYEFDAARFAPNDTKPTLYEIKLVGKADALWIEGSDYNYQWLTIVPYAGIKQATLNRVRGNPYVTDTGSWIGRQLAKAGDLRGWFVIAYADRKGVDREVVLLAPVNQDNLLSQVLADKNVKVVAKGEQRTEPVPVHESEPAVTPPIPASVENRETVPEPVLVTPPDRRLIDVMTVAEFKSAGLMKLTDAELEAFDAWMNRYLKTLGK